MAAIVKDQIVVVWNTFSGDLICSFDTQMTDPLCGIFFQNDQIFSWSKSTIYSHSYCEFKGVETVQVKHLENIGLESFYNEDFFGSFNVASCNDQSDNFGIENVGSKGQIDISLNNEESFDEPELYSDIIGIQICQNVFVICYLVNDVQEDSSSIKLAFVPNSKSCKGKVY